MTGSAAGDGGSGGAGSSSTSAAGGDGGAGGNGGIGGAIYNTGVLTLRGATITGNRAGDGGAGGGGGAGGAGDGGGGGGGTSGDGGGVSNDGGTVTVLQSTINGNSSGNGGAGGIGGQGSATAGAGGAGGAASGGGGFSDVQGSLLVANSTFASDAAGNGGAGGAGGTGGTVAGDGGSGGAGGNGGAVGVASPAGASLQNVTMAGNNAGSAGPGGTGATAGAAGAAGTAGGVSAQGSTVSLQNSLLFRNGGGNCSASIVDGGHNLSFPAAGCPATFATGDPNLGPLQDNGGPTRTISLQSGSAALDQVPATGADCPATDQRGVPRPGGEKCDIGAYEAAAPKAATGPAGEVSRRAATLTATVTPNSGDAAVWFQFGPSTSLGSQTKVQQLDGVTPTLVTAPLGSLRPNTTYHYRVQVSSTDGTAVGTERTFTTSSNPSLRSLRIKPSRFKAADRTSTRSTGATISYTDSQAATTRFAMLAPRPGIIRGGRCVAAPGHGSSRGHRACTRYVKVGTFTHKDVAASNSVRLSGRVHGAKLAPGRYRLQATPHSPGHTGKTVTATFTIIA